MRTGIGCARTIFRLSALVARLQSISLVFVFTVIAVVSCVALIYPFV